MPAACAIRFTGTARPHSSTGLPMPAAVEAATDYIERALRGGYRPGRGDVVVLDHIDAGLSS